MHYMRVKSIFIALLMMFATLVSCEKVGRLHFLPPADEGYININVKDMVYLAIDGEGSTNWTSSNPEVVMVYDGYVTGLRPGSSVVTASRGRAKASVTVNVLAREVTAAKMPGDLVLEYGETAAPTISGIVPSEATPLDITWNCSPEGIITITPEDEYIRIKAICEGETVVSAISSTGVKLGSFKVKVTGLTGFFINRNSIQLNAGESFDLEVRQDPKDLYEVVWTTSNSGVANVDQNGHVTAGSKTGSAIITATAGPYKAACTVTVITGDDYQAAIYVDVSFSYDGQPENPYADLAAPYIEVADGAVLSIPAGSYSFQNIYSYDWISINAGYRGLGRLSDISFLKAWTKPANWVNFGGGLNVSRQHGDMGMGFSDTISLELANGSKASVTIKDGVKKCRLDYCSRITGTNNAYAGTLAGAAVGEIWEPIDLNNVDQTYPLCLNLMGDECFGWFAAQNVGSSNPDVIEVDTSKRVATLKIKGKGTTTISVPGVLLTNLTVTEFKGH